MIGPVKGRIPAVLAALAFFASAGTADAQFTIEGTYATGDTPRSAYAADFNGDGRPDVVSSNQDVNTVSVFLRGTGGFTPESGSPFSAPGATSNGTVADFNGDGLADLAISDFNFSSGQAVILLRQAGGGFAQQGIPIGGGNPAGAVGAGDFNRDGRVDLVIAGWGSGNVSVYFNTVSGFALQNNYATGANPREISVADFNSDGAPDIAVLNNGSANVMTLLNTGAGAFAQEGAPTAVGTNPFGLTSGDFDGDGRPDLAASNAGDDTVSILLRSPLGGFTSAGAVAVGDQPINMGTGDFDGNGTLDIAVAVSGGSLDVIRRGASGFARDTSTPLPGNPYGVAVADFNADGRPDVAVTSLVANQLNVLLSPSPPAPPPPPPPPPTPTPTPTLDNPQVNREVNVLPVSGTVKIKRKGSNRFVDLKAGEQIPNGSSVDARNGRVTIVAAQSGTKVERADFYDGLFTVTQSRRLTTLALTEQLDCSRKARAAQKKPKSRKLWGDGKGKFRTKGRYAAATVRGTRWLTRDTCTTTKVTVRQGSVSVRDAVRKRTVIVRKGKSYTARARR